jgi:hypothetical protein
MALASKSTRPKKSPAVRRWTIQFDKERGDEILALATKRGTKPAIWIREAAFERLQRDVADPVPPRR